LEVLTFHFIFETCEVLENSPWIGESSGLIIFLLLFWPIDLSTISLTLSVCILCVFNLYCICVVLLWARWGGPSHQHYATIYTGCLFVSEYCKAEHHCLQVYSWGISILSDEFMCSSRYQY